MGSTSDSVPTPPAVWREIFSALVAGDSISAVASRFGVNESRIHSKAYRRGYRVGVGFPAGFDPVSGVSGRVSKPVVSRVKPVPAAPAPVFPLSSFIPPPILPDAAASDFSASLIPHVQALIAAGLPGIEPPRNIAELKVLVELGRKLAGLDSKQSSGKVQLFAPLRDVSRRGGASSVVVECSDGVQIDDSADSIGDYEV